MIYTLIHLQPNKIRILSATHILREHFTFWYWSNILNAGQVRDQSSYAAEF